MADDLKIVDTAAMLATAGKIGARLQTLEQYRQEAQGHLQNLQYNYQQDGSATTYHTVMEEWNAQYKKITDALGKVQVALGGTATNSDHTEDTNQSHARSFAGTAQSLTLPI